MQKEANEKVAYSIGAVARLTGIPVDTVRMWERRYNVVQPLRSDGNKRRYAAEDVARLTLIKRLVDRGNPISTVATLSEQKLRERLQLHEHASAKTATTGPRHALIYGESLPFDSDARQPAVGQLELDGAYTDYAAFERAAATARSDVLICEFPALTQDHLLQMFNLSRRIGSQTNVIVYSYTSSAVLQRLRQHPGVVVVRGPTTLASIEVLLRSSSTAEQAPAPLFPVADLGMLNNATPPRYTSKQLAEIARLPNSVKCECPKQLVDLILRLNAFEAYSLDCENRNSQDQAIHAYLYQATAHARATIEHALAHLMELEGMAVPDGDIPSNPTLDTYPLRN